jgi:hypothetical protein
VSGHEVSCESQSPAAYEESLRALASELAQELSDDGWQVASGRFKGHASDPGPCSIEFSHPLSTGFGWGLGRELKPLSSVREGVRQMLATEREFAVIRQAPRPAAHPELLKMLRVVAFAYQWPPATLDQVAEAVVGGRALDVEEGAWLVFAGPEVWGPTPEWVDQQWRRQRSQSAG